MKRVQSLALRIAGLVAITATIAACGDSSVHVVTGVDPTPGTFVGVTDEGGDITIQVDSIRQITFDCDNEQISNTFSPPEEVKGGHFDVSFTDGGRKFRVEGRFLNDDEVEGTIDDHNDHCDVSFVATRNGTIPRTPTPVRTSTPGGGVTSTPAPGETETPTEGGPTPTGATATPGGPTSTNPGPTATTGGGGSCNLNGMLDAGEQCDPSATGAGSTCTAPAHCNGDCTCGCPKQLTSEGQGESADLDSGWTGIAHDSKVVGKGTLTVALNCGTNQPGSCGVCTVSGPIASTTVVNNHRCSNDSSKICAANTDCTGGTCIFYFGAPLPLSSGAVPVCVTNKVNGSITGTANVETGHGAATVALTSSVFTGIDVDKPCPRCSGASFNTTGTCSDGPRAGLACTVHGTSVDFGNTSLDCPPNPGANVGNLAIPLNPTTETSTLAATASTMCVGFGFATFNCFCADQDRTNACSNGTCTVDASGQGKCATGPTDNLCSVEKFRGCTDDNSCRPSSEGGSCATCRTGMQTCGTKRRPCLGAATAGVVSAPITRVGTASTTAPTLVSTFCVPATSSSAVNTAGGLPGPGALILPSKTCLDAKCSF